MGFCGRLVWSGAKRRLAVVFSVSSEDFHFQRDGVQRKGRRMSPFLCPSSCRSLGTQVSDLASGFLARVLRMDSPRSSMR